MQWACTNEQRRVRQKDEHQRVVEKRAMFQYRLFLYSNSVLESRTRGFLRLLVSATAKLAPPHQIYVLPNAS